ncbi:MAG: PIN domain-containing protein [Actinomycetota bacterium]
MPSFLVLDSEAIGALAAPRERAAAARRAQAVLVEAFRRKALVRIPAAVLTEVYRGSRRDAGFDRVIGKGNRVVPLDHRIGRTAGGLLGQDGLDSCHAVDASVVATAARLGGGVVVTADADDLRSLARNHPNVVIQPLP